MSPAGRITPLLHTLKARQRIVIAISWGERIAKTTIVDHLRGTNQQHDLDLSCFVYDSNGNYVDFVGAMAQDAMDQTGCIYHSGDDASGAGGGDDESISCELAGLPPDIEHLIFVTEIRSDHVFGQVDAPAFRIADGMTNDNLYEGGMSDKAGAEGKACIMARLFREKRSPTGWALQPIGDFPAIDDVPDWGTYLTRYL